MSGFKGAFSFSFNEETCEICIGGPDRVVNLNSEEESAIKIIYSFLSSTVDMSTVSLEKRSDDYTSVICGKYNDFLRFKFTNRTKWLSLRLPRDLQILNIENPLFSAQKNKNQLHWKAKLKSIDELYSFKNLIISSCIDCD